MRMSRTSQIVLVSAMLTSGGLAAAAPSIGSRAPDFSLPSASGGQPIALSQELSKHRLTVLMFIATRCPYSNGYNGRMERLSADYSGQNVAFVGINSNEGEPAAAVVEHARSHGLTFPILKDAGSRVADLYGAQRTPEIFVVDASGALRYHGRIDENAQDPSAVRSPDLRNALDALIAGRPVPAPETKAFGCSIKRP
jgi:peroxiredoxin